MSIDSIILLTFGFGIVVGLIPYEIRIREEKKVPYKECEVCGKPIELRKKKLKIVTVNEVSGLSNLVNVCKNSVYETLVCEQCGCENVIKKRLVESYCENCDDEIGAEGSD